MTFRRSAARRALLLALWSWPSPPKSAPLRLAAAMGVQEAILTDMIPPGSASCGDPGTTSVTFDYAPSTVSDWHGDAALYEGDTFLAEMTHTDVVADRRWSMRIGTGGNIYSFVGDAYGEAAPPQDSGSGTSFFVDDIPAMGVAVDGTQNLNASLPDPYTDVPHFIHQAGTYARDADYMPPPFFSPSLAKHCSGHSCSFAAWGQQAHVPTPFRSDLIYLNSYRNCGDGLIEFTQLFHNDGDYSAGDFLSYLNVPWGGLRTSTFPDVFISDTAGALQLNDPPKGFGDNSYIPDIDETGGFSSFAHADLPVAGGLFTLPCYNDTGAKMGPCDDAQSIADGYQPLDMTIKAACTHSSGHSGSWGVFVVVCKINDANSVPQIDITVDPGIPRDVDLLFKNATGASVNVSKVIHWNWPSNGKIYFGLPDQDADVAATMDMINEMFPVGSTIDAHEQDYLVSTPTSPSITYVHGVGSEYDPADYHNLPTRLRFGRSGRDYTVFTVNSRVDLDPTRTYLYRQFILADSLDQVESRAAAVVDETDEDMIENTEFVGRAVELYSHGGDVFGAAAADAVGGTSSFCPQGTTGGAVRCTGSSTPRPTYKAFFAVTCGGRSYFGPDQYRFAPPLTDALRPYTCVGEDAGVRPEWTLIGFFDPDDAGCASLQDATYDPTFCEDADGDGLVDGAEAVLGTDPTASDCTIYTRKAHCRNSPDFDCSWSHGDQACVNFSCIVMAKRQCDFEPERCIWTAGTKTCDEV